VNSKHNLRYETLFLSNNIIHRAGTFARSLVPVRYPALLAKSVFKSDSIVVVGKNSFSIK
jgi:hypothetical protein